MEDFEDYFSSLISTITDTLPDEDDSDPFSFDEAFARESVVAEYEPYFQEMRADFIEDQDTKEMRTKREKEARESVLGRETSRTQEEHTAGLGILKESDRIYREQEAMAYQEGVEQANEGFAGRGLYMSGIREKKLGRMEKKRDLGMQSYELGEGEKERRIETGFGDVMAGITEDKRRTDVGFQDFTKDQDLGRTRYDRDWERDKTEAIEQGVLGRRREALENYSIERQQTAPRF